MYIDDFFWLPEIEDKLAGKHQVTREEAEEVFSISPVSDLWKRATILVKTFIQQAGKQMLAGIWSCFLSTSMVTLPL